MFMSARSRPPAAALAALLASACAVGPNFQRPAPPVVEHYAPADQPTAPPAAAEPRIAFGRDTQAAWWRLFGSPALDDLMTAGVKASPTLEAARLALEQSEDQARAGAGVFFPSVSGQAEATREQSTPLRLGEGGAPSVFSLFTLSGAVNYAVDLFGGERRSVEALNAAADQQRYAEGAAYLLLTGDIAGTAIARAGYADETKTLSDIVRLDGDQRDIAAAEFKAGHAAWSVVLDAEQQLASDRQSLAVVEQREAAAETLLQTLVGREQGQTRPAAPDLDQLVLPADAPVSLPSQLVRRRPDILGAEAAMHQASAQVGVATAALFPSISLTGDYGAASLSLAQLAAPAGRFWGIGPTATVPIFEGGALWFGRKAAQAGYLKAEATYRGTVLAALEQVSDQLKALDTDAEVADASLTGFQAASAESQMAEANRQAGVIADYDAMTTAIQADRAKLVMIAAKTQRLQDVVALYLACGGGWTSENALAVAGR
jgi:NodT family efflux transporter outer membrane factor (OMF) lipoprotein